MGTDPDISESSIFAMLPGSDLMITSAHTKDDTLRFQVWDLRRRAQVASLDMSGGDTSVPSVDVLPQSVVAVMFYIRDLARDLNESELGEPVEVAEAHEESRSDSDREHATFRIVELLVDYHNRSSIQFVCNADVYVPCFKRLRKDPYLGISVGRVLLAAITDDGGLWSLSIPRSELSCHPPQALGARVRSISNAPAEALVDLISVDAWIWIYGSDHIILRALTHLSHNVWYPIFHQVTLPQDASISRIKSSRMDLPLGYWQDLLTSFQFFKDRTRGIYALLRLSEDDSGVEYVSIQKLVVSTAGMLEFTGDMAVYSDLGSPDSSFEVLPDGLRVLVFTRTPTAYRGMSDLSFLSIDSYDPSTGIIHSNELKIPAESDVDMMQLDIEPGELPKRYAFEFRKGWLVLKMGGGVVAVLKYG